MTAIKFKARIDDTGLEKGWALVKFPLNVSKKLGTRGQVPVTGSVNGFAIRTSAMPTGDGCHHIMFNKAMRSGAKADVGDTVLVEIVLDAAPRQPSVPDDVRKAITANPAAKRIWAAITPRAREEWVEWIIASKKDETRVRRVEKTVERLAAGERRVYD